MVRVMPQVLRAALASASCRRGVGSPAAPDVQGDLGKRGLRRRPMALLRALTLTALALPLSSISHAGESSNGLDGRGWLERVASAASRTSYHGTMVFSTGSHMSTTRVVRYCTGKDIYEQHESLDGPPRLIYRHNQIVHTLWPQKKVAVVQQRDARAPFPALPEGGGDVLAGYQLRLEGTDRVAAHASQVMLLEPHDSLRYAQRLWAEARTGLMLRADVLDREGRVLESIAFTDLKTGVRPQPANVTAAMSKLDGYQVVKADITRTRLEDEGWALRTPVPGFKQVSCVKRPVDGREARRDSPSIVQSVWSDGLAHVSVFIEPYDASRHKTMKSSWGATGTLMRPLGDAWITVVGDVPMDALERFAAAVERLK